MYDRILVATDGSDHAERAARHALSLARRFDASVTVLAVADVAGAAGPFDAGGVSGQFEERIERAAEAAAAEVEDSAGGVPVDTVVVDGQPGGAIVDYARDHGVDLVATGTRGRSGLRRFLSGSTAEHVLRESPVPVVTVRRTEDPPVTDYERVLVPTDGSDTATGAVDHAVAVAGAFDATLHAVSVADVGVVAAGADATPPGAILDRLSERGHEATEAVAERAREAGVEAVTAVREGFPASDLLDYVDEEAIDFVAMGTHGRTGVGRLLLGSTTERVVRRSPVPVLAVGSDGSE